MDFLSVNRFVFAPESPRPWCIMRLFLAAAVFFENGRRWPYAVELYSTAGWPVPAFPRAFFQPSAISPAWTLGLHTGLLAACVMLFIGWWTRLACVVAFVLLAWFSMLDAASTMTKYTVISLHLLLLMSFSQPGPCWSVDGWFRNRQGRGVPLSPAWPRKLARVLVCSIYLGAAITKLRLPDFATGDLLEFSLLDDAFGGRPLGQWLAIHPKLLITSSLLTLVFELSFPILIWVERLRRPLLITAFLFHGILAITLYLETFSLVMFAALCGFLRESDVCWLPKFAGKNDCKIAATTTRRWLPQVAGVLFLCLLTGGLIAYQVWRDDYGVFHRTVICEPEPIDAEMAYELIDAFERNPRDYFHRIEVGSRLGYRHVFGNAETFQAGDVVHVMARLLQPHPTLELEWRLIAPAQSPDVEPEASRVLRTLDASHSYASLGFRMEPEFASGRYQIELHGGKPGDAKELLWDHSFELQKAKSAQ